jgi:hypothetical protein
VRPSRRQSGRTWAGRWEGGCWYSSECYDLAVTWQRTAMTFVGMECSTAEYGVHFVGGVHGVARQRCWQQAAVAGGSKMTWLPVKGLGGLSWPTCGRPLQSSYLALRLDVLADMRMHALHCHVRIRCIGPYLRRPNQQHMASPLTCCRRRFCWPAG